MAAFAPVAAAAVAHPPPTFTAGDNIEAGQACYYPDCKYKTSKWGAMLNHVRVSHKRPLSDLKGTFLYEVGTVDNNAAQRKLRHAKPQAVAKAKAAAQPAPAASVAPHAADVAPSGQDEQWMSVPCWVKCQADGTPLLPLQCAGPVAGTSRPDNAAAARPAGEPAQAPPALPVPQAPAPGVDVGGGAVVRLSVVAEAAAWTPSEWKAGSSFPRVYEEFALDEHFGRWLRQQRNLKKQSIAPTVQAVSRFLGILAVPDGVGRNEPGVLATFYEDDVLAEIRDLPLFQPKYSWSRKTVAALSHWCQFHIEACDRKGSAAQGVRASIVALKAQLIGWNKVSQSEKKKQNRKRKRYDAVRVTKMADCATMKLAARKAMMHLKSLHREYHGQASMPYSAQGAANVDLAGIVFLCNWAGRDGEWAMMTEAHVREQLFEMNADHLICSDHKTVDELGEAVKHISACTKEAFRLYFGLPMLRATELAFRPCKNGEAVSFQYLLRAFGAKYLPGTQAPGVNLLRKCFTKSVITVFANADALAAVEEVDKHSAKTALQSYAALTFQEQADGGRKTYVHAMGEPPAWPTEEPLGDVPVEQGLALESIGPEVVADEDSESSSSDASSSGSRDLEADLAEVMAEGSNLDTEADVPDFIELQIEQARSADDLVHIVGAEAARLDATTAVAPPHLDPEQRVRDKRAECVEAAAPVAKRGRKSAFSDEHKAWILEKRSHVRGSGASGSVPMTFLHDWLEAGVSDGSLPVGTSVEQLRHVCRSEES
jgi:hypothetical protein